MVSEHDPRHTLILSVVPSMTNAGQRDQLIAAWDNFTQALVSERDREKLAELMFVHESSVPLSWAHGAMGAARDLWLARATRALAFLTLPAPLPPSDQPQFRDVRCAACNHPCDRHNAGYGGCFECPPETTCMRFVKRVPVESPHLRDMVSLLIAARTIWGPHKLTLPEVIVRLSVNVGKLARLARGADKDRLPPAERQRALNLEFGQLVFSLIRWADDVGAHLEDGVRLAIAAQLEFAKYNSAR